MKLIFNQTERQIMRAENSSYSDKLQMHLAKLKLKRSLKESVLGKLAQKTVDYLHKRLNQKS